MFCSAEASVSITGRPPSGPGRSGAASGLPPVSWMMGGPVRLVSDRRARVSDLTGASACSRSRAITWRGSLGASIRSSTVPTAMPL